MDAVITALTTGLTDTALWAVVADTVPLLLIIIPFALGMMFLRKMIKGVSKGKTKV